TGRGRRPPTPTPHAKAATMRTAAARSSRTRTATRTSAYPTARAAVDAAPTTDAACAEARADAPARVAFETAIGTARSKPENFITPGAQASCRCSRRNRVSPIAQRLFTQGTRALLLLASLFSFPTIQ